MNNEKLPAYPRTAFDCKGDITSDFPEYNGLTKLEAFTKAAMQGLITGLWAAGGVAGHGWKREEIAAEAIEQAKTTLSELQKQQS